VATPISRTVYHLEFRLDFWYLETRLFGYRTDDVVCLILRRFVDLAALSETRFADEGSLTEVGGGYTFFWKGLPHDVSRIHGVGFVIRTSLVSQITESPMV